MTSLSESTLFNAFMVSPERPQHTNCTSYMALLLLLLIFAHLALPNTSKASQQQSFGSPPPASAPAAQQPSSSLHAALAEHVRVLALDIGPRNTQAPQAYAHAARYIADSLAIAGISCSTIPMPDSAQCPPIITVRFGPWQSAPSPCPRPNTLSSSREQPPAPAAPESSTGPLHPAPALLLCAHYDSAPGSPGAGDNASGVAVLLETARALSLRQPAAPVDIAFFPNEEEPHFMTARSGSFHYAALLAAQDALPRSVAAVDCVGWPADGPRAVAHIPADWRLAQGDLIVGARFVSRPLARALAATLGCETFVAAKGALWLDRSDHAPFAAHGVPSALVSAWAGLFSPIIHSPRDTAETLDFTLMENVVTGLVRYARGLRPGIPAQGKDRPQ